MYKNKTLTAKEFEWSDAFNCWAGPFPRRRTDARRPKQPIA